jgi:hypothetical protein
MACLFPDLKVSLIGFENRCRREHPAAKLELHGSTTVSSRGNCYPDHLFQSARRLLHRIALNDDSRGGDQRTPLKAHIGCQGMQ